MASIYTYFVGTRKTQRKRYGREERHEDGAKDERENVSEEENQDEAGLTWKKNDDYKRENMKRKSM